MHCLGINAEWLRKRGKLDAKFFQPLLGAGRPRASSSHHLPACAPDFSAALFHDSTELKHDRRANHCELCRRDEALPECKLCDACADAIVRLIAIRERIREEYPSTVARATQTDEYKVAAGGSRL